MMRTVPTLRRVNNQMDKKLTSENYTVMTDMVVYLRGSTVSNEQIEIIRQDLLVMILEAQERGEAVQSIIGEDYQAFCDEIINNSRAKTATELWQERLSVILSSCAILLLLNLLISRYMLTLVQALRAGAPLDLAVPINGGILLMIVVITAAALMIVDFMCSHSFKITARTATPDAGYMIRRIGQGLLLGLVFAVVLALIVKLSQVVLLTIHLGILLLLIGLLLIMAHYLAD